MKLKPLRNEPVLRMGFLFDDAPLFDLPDISFEHLITNDRITSINDGTPFLQEILTIL